MTESLPTSRAKLCIMGTPIDCGNLGVRALGASLTNLCWEATGGQIPTFLIGNRDNRPTQIRIGSTLTDVPVVHARLSPCTDPRHHLATILILAIVYRLIPLTLFRTAIKKFSPWIRAVSEADWIGDIRGGDSFSDIYGLRGFFVSFLYSWTVILVKGSIIHFPQTYGPYRSWISRQLARYLLRHSAIIIARDARSQEIAVRLIGKDMGVLLCPDVAFALMPLMPTDLRLNPPIATSSGDNSTARPGRLTDSVVQASIVGLNINGLMFNGGFTRRNMFELQLDYASMIAPLIGALLDEIGGEIWLIPHTYAPPGHVESDAEASAKVYHALPSRQQSRVRILSGTYDPHELKWIIGRTEFFVGSRMHSCIAALSQGIPCVGVAYSMKFQGVFDSVGMGDWVIDGRTTSNENALRRVVGLYRRRDQVRSSLTERAEAARRELRTTFQELFGANASTRDALRSA